MSLLKYRPGIRAALPGRLRRKELIAGVAGSLLGAHLVQSVGDSRGILSLLSDPGYWEQLLPGTVIAFISWAALSLGNSLLNRRYPWHLARGIRLLLQFFLCFLLPAVLIHGGTWLESRTFIPDSVINTTWVLYELPFVLLLLVVVNLVYFITDLSDSRNVAVLTLSAGGPAVCFVQPCSMTADLPAHASGAAPVSAESGTIIVTRGRKKIPLPVSEIAMIQKRNGVSHIFGLDGKVYLADSHLEGIAAMLDPALFFRANRQTIVARKACTEFWPAEHGRLELLIGPAGDVQVQISQKTAPVFRDWISGQSC